MLNASRKLKASPTKGIPASLLRHNFITLPHDIPVSEALDLVRRSAQRGDIFYLYVIDNHEKLLGVVSIRNLLLSRSETILINLITSDVVAIPIHTPLTALYAAFSNSRFLSLPVISERGKILGVVHAHELLTEKGVQREHLFEERSRGQLFELLGFQAESAKGSVVRTAMRRFPWLSVNMMGGIVSALLIHAMGSNLGTEAVELLALIPFLLVISESVGMQSAYITISNIQRAGKKSRRNLLFRELAIALLLGLACAAVMGTGLALWGRSWRVPAILAFSVALGTVWVSFLGNLIPTLAHRWKIDPKVAAGPIVLALADCSALLLYLTIAYLLLP